jgi:hypothetical protein
VSKLNNPDATRLRLMRAEEEAAKPPRLKAAERPCLRCRRPFRSAWCGNAMHLARRHHFDAKLVARLDVELRAKAFEYRDGFVVRLHVLGDFPDARYVERWAQWLHELKPLRVFGYTAHDRHSPIGRRIAMLNLLFSQRWVIRFSVPPDAPPAGDAGDHHLAPALRLSCARRPDLPGTDASDRDVRHVRAVLLGQHAQRAHRVHRSRAQARRQAGRLGRAG